MPTAFAPPARRLEPADLAWATALLAASCAGHPVLSYCCTGPDAPAQRVWLLERLLRFGLRYGRVYTNPTQTALAVWLGPGQPAASLWRLLRSGLLPTALWRLRGGGLRRLRHFLAATAWLRRQSVATTRHHYLLALAVHPTARGQGQGRRLLQATMGAMQAPHVPCYLDTQLPEQLPFYQRIGFRLMGQCPPDLRAGGPPTWGLLREGLA
ncbi:GNAT family N-acetyltransferase [Hymenobacter ruricola]|uniref:GNAT family N-acetyltransferase n=1 Tax=Hymenobacter ruricola TaxID=2791023 RepID=A0ABS0HZW7_9BACT|nr:GNAT family N-acetyltransferase [Hymenobacter ruricola]MBF9220245.1 GNAT family N-acetyltransferase [Hymenobacter ruricola]